MGDQLRIKNLINDKRNKKEEGGEKMAVKEKDLRFENDDQKWKIYNFSR